MKLKKGDPVIVVTGAYKGTRGAILKVLPKVNQVLIEGVNLKTKHQKASQTNPQGGIEKIEAPIDASNVAYFDEQAGKKSRVRIQRDEKGRRRRVLVATGKTLDN